MSDAGEIALRGRSCRSCGLVVYPAMGESCPNCWSTELGDVAIGRAGTVYSHTVVHRSTRSDIVPFVIGLVDLPEGPRVLSRIDVAEGDALRAGDQVSLEDAPAEPLGFLYRRT